MSPKLPRDSGEGVAASWLGDLQLHRARRGGERVERRGCRERRGDVLAAEEVDHEADNGDVHDEHGELEEAETFGDLESFVRDQGGGGDEGQVFRPLFAQQETGALRDQDAGEEEGGDAEMKELFVRDEVEGLQKVRNVPIRHVETDLAQPDGSDLVDVLVDEGEKAEGEGDEQKTLEQLKGADPAKIAGVVRWGGTTGGHALRRSLSLSEFPR